MVLYVVPLLSSVHSAILLNKIFMSIFNLQTIFWNTDCIYSQYSTSGKICPCSRLLNTCNSCSNKVHPQICQEPLCSMNLISKKTDQIFFKTGAEKQDVLQRKAQGQLLKKVLNNMILKSSSSAWKPGSRNRNLNLDIYCFTQHEKHEVIRNVTQL